MPTAAASNPSHLQRDIKIMMTRGKDDEKALYDLVGSKDDLRKPDRRFKAVKSSFKKYQSA